MRLKRASHTIYPLYRLRGVIAAVTGERALDFVDQLHEERLLRCTVQGVTTGFRRIAFEFLRLLAGELKMADQ